MKVTSALATSVFGLALAGAGAAVHAASFTEGFNDVGFLPTDWSVKNNSTRNSTGNPWTVGDGILDSDGVTIVVGPYEGDGMALVNYSSIGSGSGTISNWLISPEIFGISNGDTFSFYTTTIPDSAYPDRLELRMSSAGTSVNVGTSTTSVGDFTTVMLTINSALAVGGYPEDWTMYTATVSGLSAPVDGRIAFRYYVTSGGPTGANSNIIAVDQFSYTSAVPEPATWAMALGGIVALGGLKLSRRKAAQV